MGSYIGSLVELPVHPGVKFYLFVINGDFPGPYFAALGRHFPEIAKNIGKDGLITGGYGPEFSAEVVGTYLGKDIKEPAFQALLPALLLADARPNEITEHTLRLLIPLKRAAEKYGDLETFLRILAAFIRKPNKQFLRRFEERSNWFRIIGQIVEIKPKFMGISINVVEFIRKIWPDGL